MARRKNRRKKTSTVSGKAVAAAVTPGIPLQWRHDWLPGMALILAVILTYQPVWLAGFIWDDDTLITNNPCIVGPLGLKEIWTTSAADICPLTMTTFWFEHALWGLAPVPYHLVTVLQHGVCAVLLWQVLRSLQVPGAWLGAALWALHPLQVESAAWIAETKNTESTLFFLLTILFFVRWLRQRNLDHPGSRNWSYGLTLLCAALAIASKSSTVILPVILCLCAWWVERRWEWRTLPWLIPIFFMSLAAGALTLWTQGLSLALDANSNSDEARTLPERVAESGDAIWFYLGKLVWPHPLITIYPGWHLDGEKWFSYLPLLAVALVSLYLWLKRESWGRPYFFAWAYFLAALFPVLGLLNNPIFLYSPVFDHLQYLAGMGPLALAGAGLASLSGFAFLQNSRLRLTLYSLLLLALAIMSWQRAWVYLSQKTIWSDTAAQNPSSILAHYNLGNVFAHAGQFDQAITQYEDALAINPNVPQAQDNLGNALLEKGDTDGAIAHFLAAIQIDPAVPIRHYNLARAYDKKGDVSGAIEQFQATLELDPQNAAAQYRLQQLQNHR